MNQKASKHFYLKNRPGLYPNYPNAATKKLILTESIIDCASLLQIRNITKDYSVLACYGTNGLNEEIQNAILDLKELEEIIFAFHNDEAGKEAVKKYAEQFKQYKISTYWNCQAKTLTKPCNCTNPKYLRNYWRKGNPFYFQLIRL